MYYNVECILVKGVPGKHTVLYNLRMEIESSSVANSVLLHPCILVIGTTSTAAAHRLHGGVEQRRHRLKLDFRPLQPVLDCILHRHPVAQSAGYPPRSHRSPPPRTSLRTPPRQPYASWHSRRPLQQPVVDDANVVGAPGSRSRLWNMLVIKYALVLDEAGRTTSSIPRARQRVVLPVDHDKRRCDLLKPFVVVEPENFQQFEPVRAADVDIHAERIGLEPLLGG